MSRRLSRAVVGTSLFFGAAAMLLLPGTGVRGLVFADDPNAVYEAKWPNTDCPTVGTGYPRVEHHMPWCFRNNCRAQDPTRP